MWAALQRHLGIMCFTSATARKMAWRVSEGGRSRDGRSAVSVENGRLAQMRINWTSGVMFVVTINKAAKKRSGRSSAICALSGLLDVTGTQHGAALASGVSRNRGVYMNSVASNVCALFRLGGIVYSGEISLSLTGNQAASSRASGRGVTAT